jgi:flagellar basal-body rod modification protein FlgD
MATSTISSTDVNAALTASSSTGKASSDTEQRFLKLLVTQLNNQDPLNPLDNAQLTSQLAQLSTVSGIEKLNAAFSSLIAQSGSGQVLQSAAMIGRQVLAPGSTLNMAIGENTEFAVSLPTSADSVKVSITDSAGASIRTLDLGALPPGVKTVSWDGLTDGGTQAAAGAYSFNVAASAAGAQLVASPLTYASVLSVSQGGAGVTVHLSDSRLSSLSEIKQIF